MKKKFLLSMAIMTASLSMILLFLVGAKTFLPASRMAFDFADTLAAASSVLIDSDSGEELSGDIYLNLFTRRGNTVVTNFHLKWSDFSENSKTTTITTSTTTATTTDGGTGSSGGFGGGSDTGLGGDATTTTTTTSSDSDNLIGNLFLMKIVDDEKEKVGLVRDYYNMPVSGVLSDPLNYPIKDSKQTVFDVVRNGKLSRYFFQWEKGDEIATTSTFAVVPEEITPKLYPDSWIKEGQSSSAVWWFFGRAPIEAGISGTLRLMKVVDKTKQEVEEVSTFGVQNISNKAKVWQEFPDVVSELSEGEYFFELEHLSGKISSRPFQIADLNIKLPSRNLSVNNSYEIGWRSAPEVVTGELWLMNQSGNGQKIATINPQDKRYNWTAPNSPQKNIYFEIRAGERRYVSPSFSVIEAPVAIVPDCSLFPESVSGHSSIGQPTVSDIEAIVASELNQDEIVFCKQIAKRKDYPNDKGYYLPEEYDWYYNQAKNPQNRRITDVENGDYEKIRNLETSCVDFGIDIRLKFYRGTTGGENHYWQADKYRDAYGSFANFDKQFILPLGDFVEEIDTRIYHTPNPYYIENYSQVGKLNNFLFNAGYLRLPKKPDGVGRDFMLDGSQKQINHATNEALKLFKKDNGLLFVNQNGKSELDYATRQKIAEMTGCRFETSPITINPLDFIPSDFLTLIKTRIKKSWDNAITTKTKKLSRVDGEEFLKAVRDKFLIANTLDRYLLPGREDAYPAPVKSCLSGGGEFPYNFKRTNICPYLSDGFDYAKDISKGDVAYDDFEAKRNNLIHALKSLSCISGEDTSSDSLSAGLKAFQVANNLPTTGIVDKNTGILLDRLWSMPGINSTNDPNTYWDFVFKVGDITGLNQSSTRRPDGSVAIATSAGTFQDFDTFLNDDEMYRYVKPYSQNFFCANGGPSKNHSIKVTGFKERENLQTRKKFLEINWQSTNIPYYQRMAVFLVSETGDSILLEPKLETTNRGFYDLEIGDIPSGSYRIKISTTMASYYDISGVGTLGFLSTLAPNFVNEMDKETANWWEVLSNKFFYKIIGALPPPPTYSVEAVSGVFKIGDSGEVSY